MTEDVFTAWQNCTNSAVPTWFDSTPPQWRLSIGLRFARGPTASRQR